MNELEAASESRDPDSAAQVIWSAGIVNHGSYEDLGRCLESLSRQTNPPAGISVYDTGVDPQRLDVMRIEFPNVDFEIGANLGYAGGANRVLARSIERNPSTEFSLILNPDIELDPTFSQLLAEAMIERPDVAIATGKLLRPGRRTIDTAGIRFPRHGRPRDRGSEQKDLGQFDRDEIVDAASGAAMMLRTDALQDIGVDGELFDETFFAYHEDTDLCWRARRFGWKILYAPGATGIHARGWRKERRPQIDVAIRRHSFKNHYLQLLKNQTPRGFIVNLPWLVSWEILRLGFVLLKDRPMLGGYREAWNALPDSLRKRRLIQRRAKQREADRSR